MSEACQHRWHFVDGQTTLTCVKCGTTTEPRTADHETVHSCSYYCDRPECIKAQRDELRSRLAQPEQKPVPWESFFNRYCPWLEKKT